MPFGSKHISQFISIVFKNLSASILSEEITRITHYFIVNIYIEMFVEFTTQVIVFHFLNMESSTL